jgi:hypothetical protein
LSSLQNSLRIGFLNACTADGTDPPGAAQRRDQKRLIAAWILSMNATRLASLATFM